MKAGTIALGLVREMKVPQTKTKAVSMQNTNNWFRAFETFGEAPLITLREEAVRFVSEYRRNGPARWLSMLGRSGNGKTMLAEEIAKLTGYRQVSESATITVARPVFRWPDIAPELLNRNWRLLRPMVEAEVAVIDDIGAENIHPSTTAALCRVLAARGHRWTIITSNLSVAKIAEVLDIRIASRLIRDGSRAVYTDVQDYNLRGPKPI